MTVMMRLLISVFLCTGFSMYGRLNESNPFNSHKCIQKDNQVDESLVERYWYLSKFVLCHPFTVGSAFSSMNTPMCFILADLVAIKCYITIIDESIIRKQNQAMFQKEGQTIVVRYLPQASSNLLQASQVCIISTLVPFICLRASFLLSW